VSGLIEDIFWQSDERRDLMNTPAPADRLTRLLLLGGIVGPIEFTIVYLVEGATRPGYNAIVDAVSALSLTDAGWVDIVSLVVNGLMLLAFAMALRQALVPRRGWGPAFVVVAGLGFTVAGIFVTDPAQGYPPGTPQGPAVVATLHGTIHFSVGATLTFGGLILACIVFARYFWAEPSWGKTWSACSAASALATVALFVAFAYAGTHSGPAGLFERLSFSAALVWVVVLATELWRRPHTAR
jgi:hypothetical protein